VIHLRRAFVRGVLGDLKTDGSAQTLPLIGPVRLLFDEWSAKTAKRKWVFENGSGNPADFKRMIRNRIKPTIEKWNKEHGEKRDTLARDLRLPQDRRQLSVVPHRVRRGVAAPAEVQDTGRDLSPLREVGPLGDPSRPQAAGGEARGEVLSSEVT
jgi:hypothetical protein